MSEVGEGAGQTTVGAIDSVVHGGLFTTAEMRAAFADEAPCSGCSTSRRRSPGHKARLGLIPAEAAREITAKAADVSWP